MEGRLNLSRKDREALRERWLQRAGTAFERMFAQANQQQLITFTEREDMACLLSQEMATFLLEEHVRVDAEIRSNDRQPPACPKCQGVGERVTAKDTALSELPERELTTRSGKVALGREQWRCPSCRILFFSARHQAEIGDGGVQSASGGEGGASGGQGGVVPRGQ